MAEKDGWNYCTRVAGLPEPVGDARKLVTLEQDGMTWVGVRMFNHQNDNWVNNGEPARETVTAWRDLPEPARGFWDHGKFYLPPDGPVDHTALLDEVMSNLKSDKG